MPPLKILLISFACGIFHHAGLASDLGPIPQVDRAVETFMETYDVPGLSLAISYKERLIYARGYGLADVDAGRRVTTDSRFRIASLSKPITAIAIMKLVESGDLSLDDKVFGPSGHLGIQLGLTDPMHPLNRISIRDLLQHTSGGWPNHANDPMFSHPSFTPQELLLWTLKTHPLETDPGDAYAYSNFGYFLLGQIIEKVIGESYEDYVHTSLLAPLDIHSMSIAGNSAAERKPKEVTYYPEGEHDPTAFNIARMDAHGGWIASATDLVRLLSGVDGFPREPDILLPETIRTMTTPSDANPSYACGWAVNEANNWWHVGLLPGTAALMVRTEIGFNWAILTNKRGPADSRFVQDLDQLIWGAVNDPATAWPNADRAVAP